MALTPTDLPEPVVPATNKWGILAKSTTTDFPAMSWPNAKDKLDVEVLKAFEDKISVKRTIFLLVLGISIPTTDLPSITSTTLTLLTANDLAISWAIFVTLLAFVPGANSISNLVTTGPGKTETTSAVTPNSASFNSNRLAKELRSSLDKDDPSSKALSNNAVLGILVFSSSSSVFVADLGLGTGWISGFVFSGSGFFWTSELATFISAGFFWDIKSASALFLAFISDLAFCFSWYFLTLFLMVLNKLNKNSLSFLRTIITKDPVLSIKLVQVKLKANENAGMRKSIIKINEPNWPKIPERKIKTVLPI